MTEAIGLKSLHYHAIKLSESGITPEDIRKQDCGQKLNKEITQRRQRNNVLNISVIGEQSSGKSLVAYTIAKEIHENLFQKKWSIQQIDADQIEFLESVRDLKKGNECRMLDEWNEMAQTGYNATTNDALLRHVNEVQAQRHIAKVSCAPEKIVDPTARIILEVLDKDEQKQITRVLVYYFIWKENIKIQQLCGYADIDVSKSLKDKTWKAYRLRKFQRIKLLMKHRIKDARAFSEAKLTVNIIERLKNTARITGRINRDMIRSFITTNTTMQTEISIIGEDKLTSNCYGALVCIKEIGQCERRIEKLNKANLKQTNDSERIINIKKEETKVKKDLAKQYAEQMTRYNTIVHIEKEYKNINEKMIKKNDKEFVGGELA